MHKIIRADQVANASKKCNKCQKIKLREDFSKNKATNDGLQVYCKPCHNEMMRHAANKNKIPVWRKTAAVEQEPNISQPPTPITSKKRNLAATFVPPKIEKGVPIPPKGYGDVIVKFLQQLEINDSFVTPSGKVNTYHAAAKKIGIKLLARNEDPLHDRVWRTE